MVINIYKITNFFELEWQLIYQRNYDLIRKITALRQNKLTASILKSQKIKMFAAVFFSLVTSFSRKCITLRPHQSMARVTDLMFHVLLLSKSFFWL